MNQNFSGPPPGMNLQVSNPHIRVEQSRHYEVRNTVHYFHPAPSFLLGHQYEMSPRQYSDVQNFRMADQLLKERLQDAAFVELRELILTVATFLERFHRRSNKTAQCPYWAHKWIQHLILRFDILGLKVTKEEIRSAAYRTAHIRQVHIGTDPNCIYYFPRMPFGPVMARLNMEFLGDQENPCDERNYRKQVQRKEMLKKFHATS